MNIQVKDESTGEWEIDVKLPCPHNDGFSSDIIDMGDDGDGYACYDIIVCDLCGQTWSPSQFEKEFDNDF